MNIVIMAGGGGTRLWPLSRTNQPKQFLDLGSGKTLLEHVYDRARALTSADRIYIATTAQHADRVRELVPDVVAERILIEPTKRDTGPAFAAAAQHLMAEGRGDEPAMIMWSDHLFTAEDAFITALKRVPGLLTARPDSIVIVGHVATVPETVFGYIETGDSVTGEADVFAVKAFKEKPDKDTATGYVTSGRYFWNMGYISARPQYFVDELKRYEPELMQAIEAYTTAQRAGNQDEAARIYADIKPVAIDYALLERAPRIFVITGDFGWSDVGNWRAVRDVFGAQGDYAPAGHHVHVDSDNNYIYNATDRAVCMIGMKNTIVVITDDAILITDQDQSHKVKDVVAELEKGDSTKNIL